MSRKTIHVSRIIEKANDFFENSHPDKTADRKAVAYFTADILHETGNYKGFNYLESESNLHAGHWGKDGRVVFYS